jgi:hypothetical protein
MATRRGQQPLPGIGDEAYAGNVWAVGRRGHDVVLVQHDAGTPIDPRYLYWLLATAVRRLPG